MTFTYDLTTPGDLERVRYHLGDTEEATALASDELIEFRLEEDGSVAAAVISLIKYAIAKLASEPDMTADWLKIDWRRSAENWQRLLAEKKTEFGLGMVSSSGGQYGWRPDSLQTEAPAYPAATDDT